MCIRDRSYLGCKEANGSHRKIIDLYNSHKPLARGYAVKYTDAWCSTCLLYTSQHRAQDGRHRYRWYGNRFCPW